MKPGYVLAEPGSPNAIADTAGIAAKDLEIGDIVLPRGWVIDHLIKNDDLVVAAGNNSRGRHCLNVKPSRRIEVTRTAAPV